MFFVPSIFMDEEGEGGRQSKRRAHGEGEHARTFQSHAVHVRVRAFVCVGVRVRTSSGRNSLTTHAHAPHVLPGSKSGTF